MVPLKTTLYIGFSRNNIGPRRIDSSAQFVVIIQITNTLIPINTLKLAIDNRLTKDFRVDSTKLVRAEKMPQLMNSHGISIEDQSKQRHADLII